GFDILLQPTKPSLGAWSFRVEAQKIRGQWRITTWYPVATFAPPGRTQTVVGPNDLGPGNSAARASVDRGRLGAGVLALPVALVVRAAPGHHVQATDRSGADRAARERRFADEHQRVGRVAGLRQRPGGEAVVGRIAHRREQPPVERQAPELLVPLVLVPRPRG